ncbi:CDGSH iron-sulfur domain-containing protein [Streptomyces sp. NPDC012888]|uniref:CDGSH iron-sulfur domain-containing protein n=1 Tax=Streptomyces sp. NPDC012888 TaxID=3364855 RepID=UPI003679DB2F
MPTTPDTPDVTDATDATGTTDATDATGTTDATGATGGRRPRRMRLEAGGPMLVEGPVEVLLEDGTTATSDRFVVALCTCRRTRTPPWCDTSHRPRRRDPAGRAPDPQHSTPTPAPGPRPSEEPTR